MIGPKQIGGRSRLPRIDSSLVVLHGSSYMLHTRVHPPLSVIPDHDVACIRNLAIDQR